MSGKQLLFGFGVAVLQKGTDLEVDGGHGCTTMTVYLTLLNCTLKMVKTVNVMWILSQFLKKKC